MIIVFGALNIDIHMDTTDSSNAETDALAKHHGLSLGGKGASQATAAARSGADVTFIGRTGNDEFSSVLIEKLENENVDISGIKQSKSLPTSVNIYLQTDSGDTKVLRAPAANNETKAADAPEDKLNDKAFILTQTEIRAEENTALLEKAKKSGATTIMNLAPSINLSQKTLDYLDYLIVNQEEAHQLAEMLGLSVDNDEAIKIAEGLSKQGNLTCIITIGGRGCVAYTQDGRGWSVGALDVDKDIIDRSGAQDAYSGVFTACLHAGITLPRAMKRASIAASLACTQKGRIDSLPSLEDIDNHINNLDDPEEVNAQALP